MTEQPPEQPARRPSPTSRARRSAAPVPEPLRRPSPRPTPSPGPVEAPPVVAPPRTTQAAPATEAAPVTDTTGIAVAEPAAGPSSGNAAKRPASTWLAAVLVVAILALAGLDGWLLVSRPQPGSRTQRDQALSTAKTAVPLILSYNYQHFDSDVNAAKARLTGRATTDYTQAMAKTIKPTATKVHAVVQAQTDGAGVESVSANGKQVTVVVFGEQKVTNTALTAPRIDLFRVRVTMNQVAGQWLVSKFDQI